jgi:hypothetical protein
MAAADSSLGRVRMTPSQLVLMLSWDNEIFTSSDFSLPYRSKSAGEISGKYVERVADRLYAFATF